MLPLPILFGLLAQAEAMPAETQPAAQAEPPPAAQPAPTPAPPPKPAQRLETPPVPESPLKVGLRAGADFQRSGDVPPEVGYSFSPFVQYEVTHLADLLGIGLRAEFVFDRFSKLVTTSTGWPQPDQTYRTLSYFDFALLATATLRLGPLQPWAGVGAGLALGYFSTLEAAYLPGDARTTRPLAVGALGIDLAIKRGVLVGLHGEYRAMLGRPDFQLSSGQSIKPFGDRVSVQAAILYQF
jgi:hypothetical protein